MPGRVCRMNARQVEAVLSRHGFRLISQHGSHRKWRNLDRRVQVIVPEHAGRDLPLGTLRAILVTAEIPGSEWRD